MKKTPVALFLCLVVSIGILFVCSGCAGKDYSDVTKALNGVWYANGGSNAKLNVFTFEDKTAILNEVNNAKSVTGAISVMTEAEISSDVKRDIKIDDTNIILLDNGKEVLKIPYEMKDGKIVLDGGKYISEEEAKSGLQGYWTDKFVEKTYVGSVDKCVTYELTADKMTFEFANTTINGRSGEYAYFGPVSFPYELKKGRLILDCSNTKSFDSTAIAMSSARFNIVDGVPTLLYKDTPLQRTDKMPGEHGYSF